MAFSIKKMGVLTGIFALTASVFVSDGLYNKAYAYDAPKAGAIACKNLPYDDNSFVERPIDKKTLDNLLDCHRTWNSSEGKDGKQLRLNRAKLANTDLRRGYLNAALLKGVDLRGANMLMARLVGANLQNTSLRGAYLPETDFRGADLSGVDFRWSHLQGADLRGAKLDHIKLDWADLHSAKMTYNPGETERIDFSGAKNADKIKFFSPEGHELPQIRVDKKTGRVTPKITVPVNRL